MLRSNFAKYFKVTCKVKNFVLICDVANLLAQLKMLQHWFQKMFVSKFELSLNLAHFVKARFKQRLQNWCESRTNRLSWIKLLQPPIILLRKNCENMIDCARSQGWCCLVYANFVWLRSSHILGLRKLSWLRACLFVRQVSEGDTAAHHRSPNNVIVRPPAAPSEVSSWWYVMNFQLYEFKFFRNKMSAAQIDKFLEIPIFNFDSLSLNNTLWYSEKFELNQFNRFGWKFEFQL
jgi:hypothetical protein